MNRLTAAALDALIETLDRAERNQPHVWRKALFELQERLSKAQRVRRWVGAPILGFALLAPGLTRTPELITWISYSWVIGAVALMVMQLLLERIFPVLDREARIQALGSYFLTWRDDDEYEREHRRPEHDAA